LLYYVRYIYVISFSIAFSIKELLHKWLPAVAALQVLCFYGLNRSLLATTENLYLATGKPEVRTKLNLLQLVLMAALMYPLTIRYGITGAAIAAMLPSALVVVFTLHEAGKIIGENYVYCEELRPWNNWVLIMALSIWEWQDISAALSPVVRLAASIIIGILVYVGYLWWMNREIFYEIRELVGRK